MNSLALGLMSGTSGDGLSIALCSFQNHRFKLFAYKTYEYPKVISNQLRRAQELKTVEISSLNFILGHFFAKKIVPFLKQNRVTPDRVKVVGSHGHTIFHGPMDHPPHTLQIGEPSFISEETGIPVVSDFRVRDMAAGGEGAPLIPFFDHYFYGQGAVTALQNIGGIANVSVVGKNIKPIAFDTGPGNCLMDWAIQKSTRGRRLFDRNGQTAAQGKINMHAVAKMISHPFFKRKPPKSTGRELFNEHFISQSTLKSRTADVLATLTFFTAYSIYVSYQNFVPHKLNRVIVSGGGALNKTLMNHLSKLLSPVPVYSIEKFGMPAQAKEPMAFAFFALRAIEGKINHLPQTTNAEPTVRRRWTKRPTAARTSGAKREVILGKITQGDRYANR